MQHAVGAPQPGSPSPQPGAGPGPGPGPGSTTGHFPMPAPAPRCTCRPRTTAARCPARPGGPIAVLLIGAAGAGKTTIARHWADHRAAPTAHISLDDVREWVRSGFADPQAGWNENSEAQYRLARRTCGFAARNFLANGVSCIIDDAVFPDRPAVGLGGWKRHVGPGLLPVVLLPGLDIVLEPGTPSGPATGACRTRRSPASTGAWPAGTARACRSSTTPTSTSPRPPPPSTASSPAASRAPELVRPGPALSSSGARARLRVRLGGELPGRPRPPVAPIRRDRPSGPWRGRDGCLVVR